jgi:hypothetical protein
VIREVAFYNPCNNGDIHVSRELVKYTMKVARKQCSDTRFYYYHKNPARLTVDIEGLEHRPLSEMPQIASANELRSFKYKDTIFLNTWYAASPVFKSMYCTLNTLHELFRSNLKEWFAHDIGSDADRFLPTYEKRLFALDLETHKVDEVVSQWYSGCAQHRGTRVLLCNGQPMSGQTNMPPGHFEEAMQAVIDAHPSALFIVTNPEVHQFSGDNVIFSSDITDVEGCDLPEIAYLSIFCDVIVGRGSGPYSFSLTRENLTNPLKTFVCFTDDERVANWVYMSNLVAAKIVWSDNYDVDNMRAIVNKVLSESAAER